VVDALDGQVEELSSAGDRVKGQYKEDKENLGKNKRKPKKRGVR
jgi:hypothetical protein